MSLSGKAWDVLALIGMTAGAVVCVALGQIPIAATLGGGAVAIGYKIARSNGEKPAKGKEGSDE